MEIYSCSDHGTYVTFANLCRLCPSVCNLCFLPWRLVLEQGDVSYGPCHHVLLLRTNLIKKHNVRWQVVWCAKHSPINNLRKFRSQTSDVWTGEAAARGVREEKVRRERGRNKISGRKGRKLAKQCFFGSKSRLAKAAGAEPSGRMRHRRLHAAVARSTCRSQNAKSISRPGHFWHLSCWKKVHSAVARSTF